MLEIESQNVRCDLRREWVDQILLLGEMEN